MSARFARGAFASLRASARPRTNHALFTAKRGMSAQSHAGHATKSDKPWIFVSAIIFGPLLLYLVSPSARKSREAHAVHQSHHEQPASTEQPEAQEPEVMKDDEGTPADVTATIALAEESDVPKDSQSPEEVADTTVAAEQAPVGEATTDKTTSEAAATKTSADESNPTNEATADKTASPPEPAAEASPADTTPAKSEPSSST